MFDVVMICLMWIICGVLAYRVLKQRSADREEGGELRSGLRGAFRSRRTAAPSDEMDFVDLISGEAPSGVRVIGRTPARCLVELRQDLSGQRRKEAQFFLDELIFEAVLLSDSGRPLAVAVKDVGAARRRMEVRHVDDASFLCEEADLPLVRIDAKRDSRPGVIGARIAAAIEGRI